MPHGTHENMASLSLVLGLVLLAVTTATPATGCPESCFCMDTFVTCSDFKYLDLTMLPPGTDTLVLTKGEVEEIPPGFLATATSLKMLEIISVHVRIVRGSAFRGLRNMDMFSITSCTFDIVEPDGFSGLSQLGKFHISDSNFGRVGKHAFGYINSVHDIRIWSSSFETISDQAFYKLSDVASLQFYRNNITYMGNDVFLGAFKVEEASINLNRIQITLEGSFDHLGSAAVSMVLQGNTFRCSCDLAWILERPILDEFLPVNQCVFSGSTGLGEGMIRLNDTSRDSLCSMSTPMPSSQESGRDVATVDSAEEFGFVEEVVFDPDEVEYEHLTDDLLTSILPADLSTDLPVTDSSTSIPLISTSLLSSPSSSPSSSTSSSSSSPSISPSLSPRSLSSSSSLSLESSSSLPPLIPRIQSSSISSSTPTPSSSSSSTPSSSTPTPSSSKPTPSSSTPTPSSSTATLLSLLYSSSSLSSSSSKLVPSSQSASSTLASSSPSSSSTLTPPSSPPPPPTSSISESSSPFSTSTPSPLTSPSPTLTSAFPSPSPHQSKETSTISRDPSPPSPSTHTSISSKSSPTAPSETPASSQINPETLSSQSDILISHSSSISPSTSLPDVAAPSIQINNSHYNSMIDIIKEKILQTNTVIQEDIKEALTKNNKTSHNVDKSDPGADKSAINENRSPAELMSILTEKPQIAVAYSTEAFEVGNLFLDNSSQTVSERSLLAVTLNGLCVLFMSYMCL